jgi:hypothetical protein
MPDSLEHLLLLPLQSNPGKMITTRNLLLPLRGEVGAYVRDAVLTRGLSLAPRVTCEADSASF